MVNDRCRESTGGDVVAWPSWSWVRPNHVASWVNTFKEGISSPTIVIGLTGDGTPGVQGVMLVLEIVKGMVVV